MNNGRFVGKAVAVTGAASGLGRATALALVQEGDSITIDAHQLLLEVHVSEAELARRRQAWKAPAPRYVRGVQAKFAFNASSASQGAVLDLFNADSASR